MPGVLKRPLDGHDGAADAPDAKRLALDASVKGGATDSPTVNGAHGTAGGGFASHGVQSDPVLAATARELAVADEVPPIHHITGSYVPLTTLVERLAQETHNELTLLINELADMQVTQVNGYGAAHAAQVNIQKKERLFNFAQNARTKFIKLLVLAQWSRESQAVSKLIDLHSWILFRREEYRNAVNWMGELKRMTAVMKSPAPDLRTALEVLSTGRADWIADPIDLDPEPLSADEMLRGLRTINTLLTIRLNLHENIPPEMMDFTIASGRATFHVLDEFELDLCIADEDPSSQWYFIDFRFAFEPCSADVPEGPLRDHIEGRTNEILGTEGLAGCYAFLHQLVLTHKLGILRQQAFDLARGRWSEHIKVEPVHRALVVQYWANRPGPKSWIEIGVRSRPPSGASTETGASHLGMRWHRHGKEVAEHGVSLDVGTLSLETLLKQTIAKHTNFILKETKRKLKSGAIYQKGILTVKHRAHPTEPAECALKLQTSLATTIRIVQEPISGFFGISPTSEMHYRAEVDLNRLRDPAADAGRRLSLLRCNEVLHQVRHLARVRRWQVVETYRPNQETIQRLFRVEGASFALYRVPRWHRSWLLALTATADGDRWWLVETQDAPANPTPMDFAAGSYQPLRKSLRVNLNHAATLVFDPTHSILSTVERTAAAVLTQFVDARELTRRKVAYEQLAPRTSGGAIEIPELVIHLPVTASRPSWCHNLAKSVFVGLSRTAGLATTVVTGRLRQRIAHVERFNAHMDAALAFHPINGTFSFRLQTPIGEPSVGEVQQRFARIGALVRLIQTTARHQLSCTRLALDRFTFAYGGPPPAPGAPPPAPTLQATVEFPDGDAPARIALPTGNPHLRILDHLNRQLQGPRGFENVLVALQYTLDLLRALSALEHRPRPAGVRLYILPRSATCFQLRYQAPHVRAQFEARLRYQGEARVVWVHGAQFHPVRAAATGGRPDAAAAATAAANRNRSRVDALRQAWVALCAHKNRGPDWEGLGTGLLAPADAAWGCVQHVDETLSEAMAAAGPDDEEDTNAGTGTGSAPAPAAKTEPGVGLEPLEARDGVEVVMLD